MKVPSMDTKIPTEHGVVASYPDQFFGYFGWLTASSSWPRQDFGTTTSVRSGERLSA